MIEPQATDEIQSRSARKREIQGKRSLVDRLLALNERALQTLQLPDELLDAIASAQKLKRGSAMQRQIRVVVQIVDGMDYFELLARVDGMHHRPNGAAAPLKA